ncbi:MAG: polysulfide reductase NrfD [Myxococcales bacterium]|nr:polysulfide reductase NrfD [Myxococcales bacterium]
MDNAVVTLDVLHSGIVWGWYVTMNFWAKSIATGVFLLLPWLLMKKDDHPRLRLTVAVTSFVFLNVTLFFTVLDLHQPFRFWHIFAYPNFESAINLGAWLLTLFNGLTVTMAWLAWKKKDALYDKLLPGVWVVAFAATVYTAGLLGQANARELWHAPTEVAQMLLAAMLAGSATLILLKRGGEGAQRMLTTVLGLAAGVSLTIFLAEIVLAPQKSAEAGHLIHILVSGELQTLFIGGLVLGFVIPVIAVSVPSERKHPALLGSVAALSLVGLWLVKHAWLIAPQLIALS